MIATSGAVSPALDARWHSLIIFTLTLAIYLVTRAPRLVGGDAGELAAAATTGGVAHPTGYPLFIALSYLWARLPWPSAIFGLGILAAVWTALGAAFSRQAMSCLLNDVFPHAPVARREVTASASALLLGLSPVVWSQGTAYEVYSLHFALCAASLWAAQRSLWWASLCIGLLLSHHLSSLALIPGLVLMVRRLPVARAHVVRAVAVALTVPLLFTVGMVARSAQLPAMNWGWVHRGFSAWWYHVRGKQFDVWLYSDASIVRQNAALLGSMVGVTLLWVGVLAVVVGFLQLDRSRRLSLTVFIGGNLALCLGYGIPDLAPYFLPTLLGLLCCFALGLHVLLFRFPVRARMLAFIAPLIALVVNATEQNRASTRAVERYAEWTLANAPPDALVLTRQWEVLASPLLYLQTVEGRRPDVLVIDTELLRRTWYLPQLRQHFASRLAPVAAEADAYLEWLTRFEADHHAFTAVAENNRVLQQRYEALFQALIEKSASPVLVTPEVARNEQWMGQRYRRAVVGPLIRLSTAALPPMRASFEGVDALREELVSRRGDALDETVRQLAALGAAGSAVVALEQLNDRAQFTAWREVARQLDARAPTTQLLDGVP